MKHRGKEKIKVEYEVTLVRAKNLDKALNGSTIFIEWRRGSASLCGTTRRVLVQNQCAGWDEKISFSCTIFKSTHSDKFDEKAIKFNINEVNVPLGELCPGPTQKEEDQPLGKDRSGSESVCEKRWERNHRFASKQVKNPAVHRGIVDTRRNLTFH